MIIPALELPSFVAAGATSLPGSTGKSLNLRTQGVRYPDYDAVMPALKAQHKPKSTAAQQARQAALKSLTSRTPESPTLLSDTRPVDLTHLTDDDDDDDDAMFAQDISISYEQDAPRSPRMRVKKRGAELITDRHGNEKPKTPKRKREPDFQNAQKRPRLEITTKSIHYDAVYQNRRAVKKHNIIRLPADERRPGKYYILRCEQHNLSFDQQPLEEASEHLATEHKNWSSSDSALEHFAYEVIDCDGEKREENNEAWREALRKGSDGRAKDYITARDSPPPRGRKPSHATKRQSQNSKDQEASSNRSTHSMRLSGGSSSQLNLVSGEIYIVWWRASKQWFAGILLPLHDLEYVGLFQSAEEMGLLEQLPPCYHYDSSSKSFSWAPGYEDDGPMWSEQEFAFIFFEGVQFPEDSHVAWVPLRDIRVWNEKKAKTIQHSQQALDYIKDREKNRHRHFGSGDEIPDSADDESFSDLGSPPRLVDSSTDPQPAQNTETVAPDTVQEVEVTEQAGVHEDIDMEPEKAAKEQELDDPQQGFFMDALEDMTESDTEQRDPQTNENSEKSEEVANDTTGNTTENAPPKTATQPETDESNDETISDPDEDADETVSLNELPEANTPRETLGSPRESGTDRLSSADLLSLLDESESLVLHFSQPEEREVVDSPIIPEPASFKQMAFSVKDDTKENSQVQQTVSAAVSPPNDEAPDNGSPDADTGREPSQSEDTSSNLRDSQPQAQPASCSGTSSTRDTQPERTSQSQVVPQPSASIPVSALQTLAPSQSPTAPQPPSSQPPAATTAATPPPTVSHPPKSQSSTPEIPLRPAEEPRRLVAQVATPPWLTVSNSEQPGNVRSASQIPSVLAPPCLPSVEIDTAQTHSKVLRHPHAVLPKALSKPLIKVITLEVRPLALSRLLRQKPQHQRSKSANEAPSQTVDSISKEGSTAVSTLSDIAPEPRSSALSAHSQIPQTVPSQQLATKETSQLAHSIQERPTTEPNPPAPQQSTSPKATTTETFPPASPPKECPVPQNMGSAQDVAMSVLRRLPPSPGHQVRRSTAPLQHAVTPSSRPDYAVQARAATQPPQQIPRQPVVHTSGSASPFQRQVQQSATPQEKQQASTPTSRPGPAVQERAATQPPQQTPPQPVTESSRSVSPFHRQVSQAAAPQHKASTPTSRHSSVVQELPVTQPLEQEPSSRQPALINFESSPPFQDQFSQATAPMQSAATEASRPGYVVQERYTPQPPQQKPLPRQPVMIHPGSASPAKVNQVSQATAPQQQTDTPVSRHNSVVQEHTSTESRPSAAQPSPRISAMDASRSASPSQGQLVPRATALPQLADLLVPQPYSVTRGQSQPLPSPRLAGAGIQRPSSAMRGYSLAQPTLSPHLASQEIPRSASVFHGHRNSQSLPARQQAASSLFGRVSGPQQPCASEPPPSPRQSAMEISRPLSVSKIRPPPAPTALPHHVSREIPGPPSFEGHPVQQGGPSPQRPYTVPVPQPSSPLASPRQSTWEIPRPPPFNSHPVQQVGPLPRPSPQQSPQQSPQRPYTVPVRQFSPSLTSPHQTTRQLPPQHHPMRGQHMAIRPQQGPRQSPRPSDCIQGHWAPTTMVSPQLPMMEVGQSNPVVYGQCPPPVVPSIHQPGGGHQTPNMAAPSQLPRIEAPRPNPSIHQQQARQNEGEMGIPQQNPANQGHPMSDAMSQTQLASMQAHRRTPSYSEQPPSPNMVPLHQNTLSISRPQSAVNQQMRAPMMPASPRQTHPNMHQPYPVVHQQPVAQTMPSPQQAAAEISRSHTALGMCPPPASAMSPVSTYVEPPRPRSSAGHRSYVQAPYPRIYPQSSAQAYHHTGRDQQPIVSAGHPYRHPETAIQAQGHQYTLARDHQMTNSTPRSVPATDPQLPRLPLLPMLPPRLRKKMKKQMESPGYKEEENPLCLLDFLNARSCYECPFCRYDDPVAEAFIEHLKSTCKKLHQEQKNQTSREGREKQTKRKRQDTQTQKNARIRC
ncbi:hypothetical protein F53441_13282 [Fusarium austroafricanum]|uniref:Uncharacterized protein n=1 Tax=Fusarium austroafricanum TaxID=2364996 RepID=A0A8H4JST5_9HYPO|nr:hypothetical protein F53441_13282 [Fusarium austroafricanum]